MKMFNYKNIVKNEKKVRDYENGGYKTEIYELEQFNIKKIVIHSIMCLILLITILCSFKTIKSGEVGLKVRFGKIVDTSLNEGFNLKIPYIEKIVKVNIKVQKSELNVESSTKDMQIINTAIAVNYRVDNKMASYLYKTVGNSYDEIILQPAIKESIKSAIAQYNAEEITTKRAEVSISCLNAIQKKVEKYGIIVEDFNLTDFSFSSAYTQSIEAKKVAEQNLERTKLQAEAQIIEAEATKKANDLMKKSLTDELIAKQFIEKWDGKLPETYAGKDILGIFNLK